MANDSRGMDAECFLAHPGIWLLAIFIFTSCSQCASSSENDTQDTAMWFVSASATISGDGSEDNPFTSLAEAMTASAADDSIYLVAAAPEDTLDGGIALKPGQKLIGLGNDKVRLINTTDFQGGVIVTLAGGNEVSGLHFMDMRSHAIEGVGEDLTNTHIHDNLFTGAVASEEIIWSVRLESGAGVTSDVRVHDCTFSDGDSLGGIQIQHTGESSGVYVFSRNAFKNLGGRSYHLLSEDSSTIQTKILDSNSNNIGLGERNSDSILPHLRNSSKQTVVVNNYRYDNTTQVGSESNCGFEAFLEGAPFKDEEAWCDGCKLILTIEDSIFENTVTDGVQLVNWGSNSEIDATIRNTRILEAKPKQIGGGISLVSQNEQNSGNRNKLLVENSDIVGSSAYGVAISDPGQGYTSIVDLGGGELGSDGNNRIIGSASGEVRAINANPVAKNNWWGGQAPRAKLEGDGSTFNADPVLESDPRPE